MARAPEHVGVSPSPDPAEGQRRYAGWVLHDEIQDLEVVLADTDNVFLRRGALLVQVRRGTLNLDTLDTIDRAVRRILLSWDGPAAFIAVLEPNAPTISSEVRDRQRRIVAQSMKLEHVRMALLVVGGGLNAGLSRSIARALLFRNPRCRVAQDLDDAARWVAGHIGMPLHDVVATVQHSRQLCATRTP